MFLKLTENESNMDVYVNPDHIIRFVPNAASEGTILYMDSDAGLAPAGEAQILVVHENAEELFRMISRQEKPAKAGAQQGRGLI